MRTEYIVFKTRGSDLLEHFLICSFKKKIHAKLVVWIMNKYNQNDNRVFYYSEAKIGMS